MASRRRRFRFFESSARANGKVIEPITDAIKNRVDRDFGLDVEQGKTASRSPGEENCSDFKKEAGATREEKEAGACIGCKMFATKPKQKDAPTDKFTRFINNLYRIRQRRLSGFSLSEADITSLEYECLLTLDFLTSNAQIQVEYLMRNSMNNLDLMLQAFLIGNGKRR